MQQHHQVIEQALKRLYQRIDRPTATDQVHLKAALAAVKDLGREAPAAPAAKAPEVTEPVLTAAGKPVTFPGLNIAEVQALVEQGRLSVAEALEAEQASEFPRKTLIKWLEERLEAEDAA